MHIQRTDLRHRSLWLKRLSTLVLFVLGAALAIEAGLVQSSEDRSNAAALLLVYRLPILFYLAAVWTIRQTFAKLADGEIFSALLPKLLQKLGFALAGGGIASVFLTPWLWRALVDPLNGSWAAFDPSAIAIGLAGSLLVILGDLMRRAVEMRQELDGFF